MYNKQANQDFNKKREHLISLFNRIPTNKTINYFIQSCFYDTREGTFKNLVEENRREAYLHDFSGSEEEWFLKEKQYNSKFPKSESSPVLDYNYFKGKTKKGVENFEDLEITNLSVEILNFNYFQYKLTEKIDLFKAVYQSLVNDYFSIKKNALYELNEELEISKVKYSNLTKTKLSVINLDCANFYDLVEASQKDLKDFMNIMFNLVKSNAGIEIKDKLKAVGNAFPEIFTTEQDYHGFLKYMDEDFSNLHRDVSYVKKRMEVEGKIKRQKDKDFIRFLFDNGFIKKTMFDDFMIKGQLDSLNTSQSQSRPIMYSKAFGI